MPATVATLDSNEAQQRAVRHRGMPLLVLAGPGSGKTHTLTSRIAHLVGEKQILPQQMLAITFTNKAAAEMQQRLERLLGKAAQEMTICTFHRLGLAILREHGHLVSLTRQFRNLCCGRN